MAFIDNDNEKLRRQNLKELEDKRLAFAAKMEKDNFRPEKMLFCSTEAGNFIAIARFNEKYTVIRGPVFGSEEDFIIYHLDTLDYTREELMIKSEGMGGIFGFGRKGAVGFALIFKLPDESELRMDFLAGRNSFAEHAYKRNPLLSTKRRRGDSNIIWDMKPLESRYLAGIQKSLNEYYLA